MTDHLDLTRLKKFVIDNKLNRDQTYELFEIIKDLQSEVIDQCHKMTNEVRK